MSEVKNATILPVSHPLLSEWVALENQARIILLPQLSILSCTGSEVKAFLQGQLSSDVRQVNQEQGQYSSYSTAKGRMLASMLLWQTADDTLQIQLSSDIAETILKRLRMFVLRAKVTIQAQQYGSLAILGAQAAEQLSAFGLAVPVADFATTQAGSVTLLRFAPEVYQLSCPVAELGQWIEKLQTTMPVADSSLWNWAEVCAGVLRIQAATQEEYVPQMANMDLIGAISFKKGCYTGQEVVARTQYLGKLKKRTYQAHVALETLALGAALFSPSPELHGQSCGSVAQIAPAKKGGLDLLVVVQIGAVVHGVHLDSPTGLALSFCAANAFAPEVLAEKN
jgi:tRNA-modifying protein YgfZ